MFYKYKWIYKKHKFIRTLYYLAKKIDQKIFIKTIERALKYQITDTDTIERIAVLQIKGEGKELPAFEVDLNYKKRDAYYEGEFIESADLKIYDKLGEEKNGWRTNHKAEIHKNDRPFK